MSSFMPFVLWFAAKRDRYGGMLRLAGAMLLGIVLGGYGILDRRFGDASVETAFVSLIYLALPRPAQRLAGAMAG